MGIPCFSKVWVTPRLLQKTYVFANHKKSEENFHFLQKKMWK